MEDEDVLNRAKQRILDDQIDKLTRDETQQYHPSRTMIFKPDERLNVSSFERGSDVLMAWRTYDSSRRFFSGYEERDWFGAKVDGLLWLPMGVDKATG